MSSDFTDIDGLYCELEQKETVGIIVSTRGQAASACEGKLVTISRDHHVIKYRSAITVEPSHRNN